MKRPWARRRLSRSDVAYATLLGSPASRGGLRGTRAGRRVRARIGPALAGPAHQTPPPEARLALRRRGGDGARAGRRRAGRTIEDASNHVADGASREREERRAHVQWKTVTVLRCTILFMVYP